jgi:protoporphyrinogen/coproporphyrinogen III oxidase
VSGRVVVVGAGIAGLTTADRLLREDDPPDVVVLEAGDRAGGKIASIDVAGLALEAGPDSLLARKPWAVDLVRELGMADDLVPSSTARTHIWSERGLIPFPSGPFGISTDPFELWRWPGMSRRGKVRAVRDLVAKPRPPAGDESLGSLLRRRIGDEATDALVAPLLGGLFAGDVDRLSVRATFPELLAWERDHGSLIRGARAASAAARSSKAGPRPPMFVRLRGGLRRIPDALVERIGAERVRTGTSATRIRRTGDRYAIETNAGALEADAIVLATPAFATAGLVADVAPEATDALRAIPYVNTAVVLLVYGEGTDTPLPESSGFVVPRGRLAMTACTLVSKKWPDPAFGSRAVARCFVGAAGIEDVVEEPDDHIVEGVARQLAALLPLPDRPEAASVVRWPAAMPQYEVGHLDAVDRIERALPPGVVVAGQAYRGAGIPDSIRQGAEAAGRVSAYVSGRAGVTAEGPAEGAEAAAEAAAEGAEGERVR